MTLEETSTHKNLTEILNILLTELTEKQTLIY